MQTPDQAWQQGYSHILGEGEGDFTAVGIGIEARARYQPGNVVEHDPEFGGQLPGAGRGLHPAIAAGEQRVAKEVTQAGQGFAHGWLGDVQPLRGPRNAALLQQGLQGNQQVQVDFVEIEGIHRCYMISIHEDHNKNTLDIY